MRQMRRATSRRVQRGWILGLGRDLGITQNVGGPPIDPVRVARHAIRHSQLGSASATAFSPRTNGCAAKLHTSLKDTIKSSAYSSEPSSKPGMKAW